MATAASTLTLTNVANGKTVKLTINATPVVTAGAVTSPGFVAIAIDSGAPVQFDASDTELLASILTAYASAAANP